MSRAGSEAGSRCVWCCTVGNKVRGNGSTIHLVASLFSLNGSRTIPPMPGLRGESLDVCESTFGTLFSSNVASFFPNAEDREVYD